MKKNLSKWNKTSNFGFIIKKHWREKNMHFVLFQTQLTGVRVGITTPDDLWAPCEAEGAPV